MGNGRTAAWKTERAKQRKFRKSQQTKGKLGGRPKSPGFTPAKAEGKAQKSVFVFVFVFVFKYSDDSVVVEAVVGAGDVADPV
jgi:hypothetical protein